jgi:hypothetical protein
MGKDFYDQIPASRETYEEASDVLGWDVAALCFDDDDDDLHLMTFCQPCILTTEIAMLDHILWSVEHLSPAKESGDHDPSTAVRRHAGRCLAALLHASAADIDIRRLYDICGWGPPRPYLKGRPAPFDLSFSHDGVFVAYAMIPLLPQLTPCINHKILRHVGHPS